MYLFLCLGSKIVYYYETGLPSINITVTYYYIQVLTLKARQLDEPCH